MATKRKPALILTVADMHNRGQSFSSSPNVTWLLFTSDTHTGRFFFYRKLVTSHSSKLSIAVSELLKDSDSINYRC